MKIRDSGDGGCGVLVVGVSGGEEAEDRERGLRGGVIVVVADLIEQGERGLCGGVIVVVDVIVGVGDGVRGGIVIVV